MKNNKKDKWGKKDIFGLSLGLQGILKVFIDKKSNLLTYKQIKETLGAKGDESKAVGGGLSAFSKMVKKEPLITRISKEEWVLNDEYRKLVGDSLKELDEIRKKASKISS